MHQHPEHKNIATCLPGFLSVRGLEDVCATVMPKSGGLYSVVIQRRLLILDWDRREKASRTYRVSEWLCGCFDTSTGRRGPGSVNQRGFFLRLNRPLRDHEWRDRSQGCLFVQPRRFFTTAVSFPVSPKYPCVWGDVCRRDVQKGVDLESLWRKL